MQDDRQDYANHARNDWQDFYEQGGGYYYGGYYGGYYGHTAVVVDSDKHDHDRAAALNSRLKPSAIHGSQPARKW